MLNGDGNENGKKSIGLISKKTILHGSTLLVHFFDVVLHDYNVKRPSYTFYVRNVVCAHRKFFACVPVRFFYSLPLIFNSLTASISHFLTANFRIFLPTKFVSFVFYLTP